MTKALIKQTDRFAETSIDDETIIMDLGNAEFFSLNATAGSVWRAINGERDRDMVLELIAREYDAAPSDIADEVDQLLARLREAGFVDGA